MISKQKELEKKDNFRGRNRRDDKAWNSILPDKDYLERIKNDGGFTIKSKQIKKKYGYESRLIANFTTYKDMPDIFKEKRLSVLPIERGKYLVGEFNPFEPINDNEALEIIPIKYPREITTIDYSNFTSESALINAINASNVLEDLLSEEEFTQTISGRMTSGDFSFTIDSSTSVKQRKKINVSGSQIEIDGGFESKNTVALLEAKIREEKEIVNSFIIRQLYYPYRVWKKKTDKDIYSIFIEYCNGIMTFYVYQFTELNHYNSLRLVKEKKYKFV